MGLLRIVLGFLVLSWDKWTSPTPPQRTSEQQKKVDAATRHLVLFQLHACPFCVKVRRQMRRQGLNIAMKDIARDASAARELVEGGKLDQVPCLRIEKDGQFEWLYESDAINGYLKSQFGAVAD